MVDFYSYVNLISLHINTIKYIKSGNKYSIWQNIPEIPMLKYWPMLKSFEFLTEEYRKLKRNLAFQSTGYEICTIVVACLIILQSTGYGYEICTIMVACLIIWNRCDIMENLQNYRQYLLAVITRGVIVYKECIEGTEQVSLFVCCWAAG